MSQYATIPCPNCHRDLRIRSTYFGLNVHCKFCSHPFQVRPEDAREPIPEAVAAAPAPSPEDLARENLVLRERWADATTKAEIATRRLNDTEAARLNLAERITSLTVELRQLQGRAHLADDVQEELKGARGEIEELRSELTTLRGRADEADRLRDELDSRRDESDRLRAEVEELRQHASRGDEEREGRLAAESARAALQEEFDRHRGESSALRGRASEADRLSEDLRNARDESERLREEVAEARRSEARVGEIEATFEQVQERLRIAEGARDELGILRSELEQLRADLPALRARADEADRLAEALRAGRDEAARLQAELGQVRESAACVEVMARQIEEAMSALAARDAELADLRARMGAQATDFALQAERLRQELAPPPVGVDDRDERVAGLAAELEGSRREADRLRGILAHLEGELSRREREVERFGIERDQAARDAEELRRSRRAEADLAGQVAALQAERDAARRDQGSVAPFRPRPVMQPNSDLDSLRSDLETWLSEAHARHRKLLSMAGGLDAQVVLAREELASLHRDLVLGQWGSDDEYDEEFPIG